MTNLFIGISFNQNTTPGATITVLAGSNAPVVFAGLNASVTPIVPAANVQPTPVTVSDLNVGVGGGINVSGSIAVADVTAGVTTTAATIMGTITANPALNADVIVTLSRESDGKIKVCDTATLKAGKQAQSFSLKVC